MQPYQSCLEALVPPWTDVVNQNDIRARSFPKVTGFFMSVNGQLVTQN